MNDIDEFLEKRCKNDVLRKMKNVFQLQIMRYVIKTHQKMLFGQIFGQKTFFGQKFDDLSQIYLFVFSLFSKQMFNSIEFLKYSPKNK